MPYYLAKEQAKQGHEVTIFASDYGTERLEIPDGVRLKTFKTLVNISGFRITPRMINADFKKYDIIHLHNYRTFQNVCAVSAARKIKAPYVIHPHGSLPTTPKKLIKIMYDIVWGENILSHADKIIGESNESLRQYKNWGLSEGKVTVVHNGIEWDDFKEIPSRGEFRLSQKIRPNEKIVLYLGRIHKRKGLKLLVRAFARLNRPDVKLVIAGYDDGYQSEVEQEIEKFNITHKVLFTGGIYGIEKLKLYTDADVFVLPSRYEAFGITVLEALACGMPVIVSDKCGIKDILNDKCGKVVANDEEELANAILNIIEDDTIELFQGKRRDFAQQYSWSKIAEQMIAVYKSLKNYN